MFLSEKNLISIYIKITELINSDPSKYSEYLDSNGKASVEKIIKILTPNYIKLVIKFIFQNINDREKIMDIVLNFPKIFLLGNNFKKRISFLYNSYELYGLLTCIGNDFEYYSLNGDDLTDTETKKITRDFILKSVLSFYENPYLRKIMNIDNNCDLEAAINIVKENNKLNPRGYHLK